MAAPCALVASCCSLDPAVIISQILGQDELPPEQQVTDGIVGYPWSIENKYYTANVQLCSTPAKTIGDAEFAERLEAVIIVFDDKASSFEAVKQWMPFINQLSPSTRILACQQFTASAEVSRHEAQLWCLDNSFELVELEQAEEDADEDEDEYDITGMKRIIASLHAHTWSNLELKESRGIFSMLQSEMLAGNRRVSDDNLSLNSLPDADVQPGDSANTHFRINTETSSGEENIAQTVTSSSQNGLDAVAASGVTSSAAENAAEKGRGTTSTHGRIDSLLNDDTQLFRAIGSEDPGGESFEELFSKMAAMKERASAMTGDDRKKYAEQVAVAFWRALGGDEEEVDGLAASK
ncbi:alpha- and gamma-adaptin-binding protein p34-like [Asterias amurensis]|uniref:alpha- and gamma-adaptin-binding protein p34-like n=1 Tax=Asterias amurensis TaxID=7602 RepID=UPI003AB660D8